MARWLVAWTLFISVATTGSYAGTNALIAQRAADPPSTAMLPLADGGPGTSAGRRAQRARLDAFLTGPLGILSFDTNDVGEAGSEHPGLAMRS